MNICKGFSKLWFLGVLLVAFVAGCGGNDSVVATNSNKAISAYSVAGATGTVDESAKTIAVNVPAGTSKTALVATFTTTGSGVKVGTVAQKSATTPNDFTTSVKYTVTATDNTTVDYTVTVSVAAITDKAITAYSFAGVTGAAGTIAETATPKTISVNVPSGTDVTKLAATFTATAGASVKVGAAVQTSGTTLNNFTTSVVYTVTAADASTVDYTVTVTPSAANGPAPVNLLTAANYVIFANTAISNATTPATITGNMGVGPGVTSTAITGFALDLPAGSAFSTSTQVPAPGKVYAFNYANPTPVEVTTASNDMGTAYDDAAGRLGTPSSNLNLGGGNLAGKTLAPGLYTWGTDVTLPFGTNVTLSGGPNDVWIFQIAGNLTTGAATNVFLGGSAKAKNIFWQVAGTTVSLGAGAHFEGVVLAKFKIVLGSMASANGRLLAQTAVNLDKNAVTQPAP